MCEKRHFFILFSFDKTLRFVTKHNLFGQSRYANILVAEENMTVYIEYAILDNLVFDYLLLKAAMKTGRIKFTEFRLVLSALTGTFFALVFPLANITGVLGAILKIMVGEVMVFTAGKYRSVSGFIKAFALFASYTFTVGGAMTGVCYLLGLRFDAETGLALLSDASDVSFGAIVLSGYLFAKLAFLIFGGAGKSADIARFSRTVSLNDGNGNVLLGGIIDTGNRLYDRRTGKPVSVLNKAVADKLILGGVLKMRGAHYLPYSTIHGRGKILVFEIDRLVIYCGDKRNIIDNAMIGVSPENALGETDVILHAGLING